MPSAIVKPEQVVVHPLVLLSVVDHYKRMSLAPGKRVIGVLLGQWNGHVVNVTNCYAIPFEESDADPSVWFIDHNFHENMSDLFKKVSAKERPVGWYHTGGRLCSSDLKINDLFQKYCPAPVLTVVDPTSSGPDLPFNSYFALEEVKEDGTSTTRTFAHINSSIESEEAEEIGVEHLLRDIKEDVLTGLGGKVANKLDSLRALERQLDQIEVYLGKVIAGELPINHQINYALQDMFNLLPNVHNEDAKAALTVSANDHLSMIYVGSLARAVLAMHELIDNKLDIAQKSQQQLEKTTTTSNSA